MSVRRGRVCAAALAAVTLVAGLVTACSAHRSGPRHSRSATRPAAANATSTLSAALTGAERDLALDMVRDAARATRPHPRPAWAARLWSSNVTRVIAAVGSLSDAVPWKQPGTSWQLSDRREAAHPVLIVQMFGQFRFFHLRTPAAGGPPVVARYDVSELTYVISTLDGAHLSTVRGRTLPDVAPARTLFAR